jgi:long-chain fatty acid transport protein
MLAALASADSASAGGFEIPDNGTQAVGRGGAFVAKADDPTAIYYNPAGLARQRGTNFLFNANILLHSFEFQRLKQFPDDPQDAETPWGNAPFPVVKNIAGPFVAPFVALTTDFGYFDRVTFGAGLFGPSTVGNRTFPLGVENKPAASRYDYVQSRSSILFPTASAAVRVTPWLDLGLSAHLVLASFDQTTVSYADLGKDICKNPEYFRCDSLNTLIATGTSFGATIGAMARPSVATAFGLSLRTPINITAVGQVTPEAPRAFDKELTAGAATLQLQLPWMIKAGGRYIGMDADFELYDLELDVTYEAWGVAQKFGPIVDIPTLGAFKDIQTVVLHGYNNTVGIRGGGAYNIDTGEGSLLSLRAGAYFDSPATDYPYTRLDFDTLAKVAGTFGIGYKVGSFDFNLAYAAVASVPRLVGEGVGEIRPVNGVKNGSTVGADDQPLPAVNEGSYRGFTHIISVGVSVSIDSFFGPPRQIHYGNDYEPNYVGEEGTAPEKKKIEEKKKLDEEKIREEKPSTDDEKKREVEKPEKKPPPDDEKKPEKKPDKKITPPPDDLPEKPEKPPEKPPEVKKPPPPPPPPPPPEKPPSKRREWWEEID